MTPEIRISAATLPGDPERPNQDRYVIEWSGDGALLAVIDGATGPDDARPDGGDYAEALCEAITVGFASGATDPRALLVAAIRATVAELGLPAPSQPSAAVALAFVGPSWTRFAVLGDCIAVAYGLDGDLTVLNDDRLAFVAAEARARLDAASEDDPRRSGLREALVKIEREARNAHGGYFIAADEPESGWEAVSRTLPTDQLRGLALATDGAAAGPRRYGVPGEWSELLDIDAPLVLDAIRQAETEDPDRGRWPRSKVHDDATLAIATLRR